MRLLVEKYTKQIEENDDLPDLLPYVRSDDEYDLDLDAPRVDRFQWNVGDDENDQNRLLLGGVEIILVWSSIVTIGDQKGLFPDLAPHTSTAS